jgi:hypothetical protein
MKIRQDQIDALKLAGRSKKDEQGYMGVSTTIGGKE